MATRKSVEFLVKPHEPLVIIATGADGKKYSLSIRLAVLDVVDTGVTQALDPSLPTFEFRAQMVADTKAVEP